MRTKKSINKKIIATITTLLLTTACSTNKYKAQKIINALELQNAVIRSVAEERTQTEDETKARKDEQLLAALNSVKESNNAIINKLKPKTKKECKCGKNERTND